MFAVSNIAAAPVAETEKVRNEKVAVYEVAIQPGATVTMEGKLPSAVVYLKGGTIEAVEGHKPGKADIKRGDFVSWPTGRQVLKNVGPSEVRFLRIDFLGKGEPGAAPWGTTGLSPHYKMLLENQYQRSYDIKIPAGGSEPQHTHHARVVICFSSAELEHIFPDGRKEVSTMKTDEVAYRPASTHVGHNKGKTNFWAIAIEPK